MDDFGLERDVEAAENDGFYFSPLDEDEGQNALSNGGTDFGFGQDADENNDFDEWDDLQTTETDSGEQETGDEDAQEEALEGEAPEQEYAAEPTPGFTVQEIPFTWGAVKTAEPELQAVSPSAAMPVYRYCQVRLSAGGPTYAYRTDDRTIEAGDFVMVQVGLDKVPKPAQVISVGDYAENTVPYTLEKTGVILRKATAKDRAVGTNTEKSTASARATKVPQADKQPEIDEDELKSRQERKLLIVIVILLTILAAMMCGLLYTVNQLN